MHRTMYPITVVRKLHELHGKVELAYVGLVETLKKMDAVPAHVRVVTDNLYGIRETKAAWDAVKAAQQEYDDYVKLMRLIE